MTIYELEFLHGLYCQYRKKIITPMTTSERFLGRLQTWFLMRGLIFGILLQSSSIFLHSLKGFERAKNPYPALMFATIAYFIKGQEE